jgi:hypothetical protein
VIDPSAQLRSHDVVYRKLGELFINQSAGLRQGEAVIGGECIVYPLFHGQFRFLQLLDVA